MTMGEMKKARSRPDVTSFTLSTKSTRGFTSKMTGKMRSPEHFGVATAALCGQLADDPGVLRAAPDLRDTLRELLEACEADCGVPAADDADDEAVGFTMHGPMATTFGMLRRARAALSKAEGRSLSSASGQEGGE